jgi:hypothetical protein
MSKIILCKKTNEFYGKELHWLNLFQIRLKIRG